MPITVSVVSALDVARAGVGSTLALSTAAPGLVVNQQGNVATPFIRGIGNPSAVIGQESSVATYVDGVYIASPQADIFTFNNIDRIEVLKGPQGTLFGRNATGGVIQVITRQPSFQPHADVTLGYGNYETFSSSAYATAGLSDTLAMDVAAVGSTQQKGWGRNLTSGDDLFRTHSGAIRSKLLWKPDSSTSVTLAGDYGIYRTQVGENYHIVPNTVGIGGVVYAGFYNTLGAKSYYLRASQYGASSTIKHDFGGVRLNSITAYRSVNGSYSVDQDASPPVIVDAFVLTREKNFSQEVQLLSSSTSKVQWLVGGYFYDASAAFVPITLIGAAFGGAQIGIFATQKTRSYAGFGQASGDVFANTKLTLGLRYTDDRRNLTSDTVVSGTDLGGPPAQRAGFSKLTWRIGLDHHFSEQVMGYVTYNRGFKGGLFNTIAAGDPVVKPEVLDSFEGGFKTELFDRRIRFNISAFHYNYRDIQVDSIVNGGVKLLNAAAAKVDGADVDFQAVLGGGLSLNGGGAYIDGRYNKFPNAPYYIPDPSGAGGNILATSAATCPAGHAFTGTGCDASGNRIVQAPKLTFFVELAYSKRVAAGAFDANVRVYRNSGFAWSVDNTLDEPSYALLSGSLGWQSPSGRIDVRLWGQNLLNQKHSVLVIHELLGDHSAPAAPRTYGLTLGAHF